MDAADAAQSLFPAIRLYLDEDACEADEMEASQPPIVDLMDQMQISPTPPISPTPSYELIEEEVIASGSFDDFIPPFQLHLIPVEIVEEPEVIEVSSSEEEEEEEQEEQQDSDLRDVLKVTPPKKKSSSHQARYGTRSAVSTGVFGKQTLYPKGNHRLRTAIDNHLESWHVFESESLKPPEDESARLDPRQYHSDTELIGRYLIERKFPLIGVGSTTLVFLINKGEVAKVARFDRSVNRVQFERHRLARNLDVQHSKDHPACFAETHYLWVTPQDINPLFRWQHEMYIQERLIPLVLRRGTAPDFDKLPNGELIGKMKNANPSTPFNQWGFRIKTRELVCYDYQ